MMRFARVLRYTMITIAGLVGAIAGLAGLVWLGLTEPWYDDDVIKQMMPPSPGPPAQLVDETPRLAQVFPIGTTREAAMARLGRNGFSCRNPRDQEGHESVICSRKVSLLICATTYVFTLRGDTIEDAKATSQTLCL
jgi:hypothetical protein